MTRVAFALALCVVLGFLATATNARPASTRITCPKPLETAAAYDVTSAVRAVKRLVPHEYARLTSMGSVAWRHFQIMGVVLLDRTFFTPQPALVYRNLARRLCGTKVADWSWGVFLHFPECQLPCSEDVALLTLTRSGWRMWYSEFRRP